MRTTTDDADQPLKLRRDGDYVRSEFYFIHRYLYSYVPGTYVMHKMNYLLFFPLSVFSFDETTFVRVINSNDLLI